MSFFRTKARCVGPTEKARAQQVAFEVMLSVRVALFFLGQNTQHLSLKEERYVLSQCVDVSVHRQLVPR